MKFSPIEFRLTAFAYTLLSLAVIPTSLLVSDPYVALGVVPFYLFYLALLSFLFVVFLFSPERTVTLQKSVVTGFVLMLLIAMIIGIPVCKFTQWRDASTYGCTIDPELYDIRNAEVQLLIILAYINLVSVFVVVGGSHILRLFSNPSNHRK